MITVIVIVIVIVIVTVAVTVTVTVSDSDSDSDSDNDNKQISFLNSVCAISTAPICLSDNNRVLIFVSSFWATF